MTKEREEFIFNETIRLLKGRCLDKCLANKISETISEFVDEKSELAISSAVSSMISTTKPILHPIGYLKKCLQDCREPKKGLFDNPEYQKRLEDALSEPEPDQNESNQEQQEPTMTQEEIEDFLNNLDFGN